ncbi:probable nucleoredoxin 1 [Ziziphus jujuba]|uniref:protein-disulfide reductase n=1 Tax=Ziziphus jujuba TaxID=326968 RepID=A0ABM3ZX56_ZIZJJ|nr:probable nucleoredoxin 1 [Ziziphus jujuba]
MTETTTPDYVSLLSSTERDFLVRNNGDQVKIDSLKGKKFGLYFSASWCGPCRRFTPNLVKVYYKVASKGDFEVVFISADKDEESFNGYFSKMPWLAVPFSDSETRYQLDVLFRVSEVPYLMIIGENGNVLTDSGVEIIGEYGAEGYPFTVERIKELKDQEDAAKQGQSLRSILVSPSRDFVISPNGNKVPVSELEGKTVGLYFSDSSYKSCVEFTLELVEVYEKLKAKGESFEIVLIPLHDDKESFEQDFKNMPWFAFPDKSHQKLVRYCEISVLPALFVIGPDGKTLTKSGVLAVAKFGDLAYPFTPEKFKELLEIEKAKEEAQTLESILVLGDLNFVIGKDGAKEPVSELVGKNILLYFSAHWLDSCRKFLPKLIKTYHDIKAKDSAFEVIFISSDRDQPSFDEFFSSMPWLALPFSDERKKNLQKKFKSQGTHAAIAIGPSGRTVSKKLGHFIAYFGPDAYPFTEEKFKHLDEYLEEMAKQWPEKVTHKLHAEHELLLTRRNSYYCNGCRDLGYAWSYLCENCDFDLHPNCALKNDEETDSGPTDKREFV